MPGFFDRINSTNSDVLTNRLLKKSKCYEDFNLFVPKPVAPDGRLEAKRIWEEDTSFGSDQLPQRSALDPPLINNVLNAMQFVNSGNIMHTTEKHQPGN